MEHLGNVIKITSGPSFVKHPILHKKKHRGEMILSEKYTFFVGRSNGNPGAEIRIFTTVKFAPLSRTDTLTIGISYPRVSSCQKKFWKNCSPPYESTEVRFLHPIPPFICKTIACFKLGFTQYIREWNSSEYHGNITYHVFLRMFLVRWISMIIPFLWICMICELVPTWVGSCRFSSAT